MRLVGVGRFFPIGPVPPHNERASPWSPILRQGLLQQLDQWRRVFSLSRFQIHGSEFPSESEVGLYRGWSLKISRVAHCFSNV